MWTEKRPKLQSIQNPSRLHLLQKKLRSDILGVTLDGCYASPGPRGADAKNPRKGCELDALEPAFSTLPRYLHRLARVRHLLYRLTASLAALPLAAPHSFKNHETLSLAAIAASDERGIRAATNATPCRPHPCRRDRSGRRRRRRGAARRARSEQRRLAVQKSNWRGASTPSPAR